MKRLLVLSVSYMLVNFFCLDAAAQNGIVVKDSLYARSLIKTLTGENPLRQMLVYLPPSYYKTKTRHYPVIYLLHGIADTDSVWVSNGEPFENIASVMDSGIHENRFGEMIIVMPDEKTNWFGSFYVNSSVTGNWEDLTANELVNYVDKKYRTDPNPQSRAIAGHSMGGYGAITLGMKHPEVFSIVYGMNPALIQFSKDVSPANPSFQQVLNVVLHAKSPEDLFQGGRLSVGLLTVAQAFSPNPANKPFFADLPFRIENNIIIPAEPAYSNWKKNFPVEMISTYHGNIRKLKAFKFDSGYEDDYLFIPVGCKELSDKLSAYNIDHVFEEYNGDHRNRMWGRNGRMLTEVLPYIWFNFEK
jgi:enterochelin esterase-like enzyme